jgi:hypothetical protein
LRTSGRHRELTRAQSAAYPFTRLRADGDWVLSQNVQMDIVVPLASNHVTGRLEPSVESALRDDPALIPRGGECGARPRAGTEPAGGTSSSRVRFTWARRKAKAQGEGERGRRRHQVLRPRQTV